jgi:hypothetical protein
MARVNRERKRRAVAIRERGHPAWPPGLRDCDLGTSELEDENQEKVAAERAVLRQRCLHNGAGDLYNATFYWGDSYGGRL